MINIEFKAGVKNINSLEAKLKTLNPVFIGEDHQIDTYFTAPNGRLKLREGIIENALIFYTRPDIADTKQSNIILYKHEPQAALKQILTAAHGIKAIVDKKRKIYFIDNVKFHFDQVKDLGSFIEVEAIDENDSIGIKKLKEQCTFYADLFEIKHEQYIDVSYSDLIQLRQ